MVVLHDSGDTMGYTGEKKREYDRKWKKENRDKQRKYVREIRLKVIQLLGGKCINCGCDNLEALEINHINGGGHKEKIMKHGPKQKSLYYDILAGRRNDVELTCKVCNSLHYLVKIKGLPNKWKIIYQ